MFCIYNSLAHKGPHASYNLNVWPSLFLAGAFKTWTYGLILILHAASTFSSYSQYLDAFNNLLFFAAWPMLAACLALFLLREADTLLSVNKS